MCDGGGGGRLQSETLAATLRAEEHELRSNADRYGIHVHIQGCAVFYGFGMLRGMNYQRPEPVVVTELGFADVACVSDAEVVSAERDALLGEDLSSVKQRTEFQTACLWSEYFKYVQNRVQKKKCLA